MKLDAFCERYCLDARSFEEKNARSLALGKERLAAGKTGQAMRLFAYNYALNQNRPKTSAQAGTGTKWKVRVWKNNKVVKTLTVEKDDEPFVTAKVKGLGIDWDKATVHDPKTMKQQKNYKNANASKAAAPGTSSRQIPNDRKKNNVKRIKEFSVYSPFPPYLKYIFWVPHQYATLNKSALLSKAKQELKVYPQSRYDDVADTHFIMSLFDQEKDLKNIASRVPGAHKMKKIESGPYKGYNTPDGYKSLDDIAQIIKKDVQENFNKNFQVEYEK